MIEFAAAVFLLLITPGPGVLSIAGAGSAYGFGSGWSYGTGLFFGSNLVMLAAATGLAAVFLASESFRIIFTIASTLYLLYLAARIAFAGTKIAFIEAVRPPSFMDGILLQIINPKAYAVGVFVFSSFSLVPGAIVTEIVLKFVILNIIWVPIHIGWLMAGVSIDRLDLPPRTQRAINVAMALAMLAVVLLAMRQAFFA